MPWELQDPNDSYMAGRSLVWREDDDAETRALTQADTTTSHPDAQWCADQIAALLASNRLPATVHVARDEPAGVGLTISHIVPGYLPNSRMQIEDAVKQLIGCNQVYVRADWHAQQDPAAIALLW